MTEKEADIIIQDFFHIKPADPKVKEIHCPGCDKLLISWGRWPAIDHEEYETLMGMYYCKDCYREKRIVLAEAIQEHQKRTEQ